PFGALLVKDGQVILRAENTVFTGRDMTNHAEMNLVKEAMRRFEPTDLLEATLYTSTEPCALCSGAIYWSGVGRGVIACPGARLALLAGIGLAAPCGVVVDGGPRRVVVTGPLPEEAAAQTQTNYWAMRGGERFSNRLRFSQSG